MCMKRSVTFVFLMMLLLLIPSAACARSFNDKLINRPYADMRAWHLGFSVGAYVGDLNLTHNGLIIEHEESSEQWRIEQPGYQPGFCVNGLFDLRLNNYFSVRFTPGMYFGSMDLRMRDFNTGAEERQNLKTTYVVLPLEVKYAAMRWRNARPYLTGGIMPAFDVGKKRSDFIQLKSTNIFATVGFGFDFYLPYFKLVSEVKFAFGLTDILQHERPDLTDDPEKFKFTQSLSRASSKMVILTFYFE